MKDNKQATKTAESREYTAEFGIYVNCHISGIEKRTICAGSVEEAKSKADELAAQIEQEMRDSAPDYYKEADYWADLEELYED